MATQTNEIKKALRIAFPGVKFTCKTHYHTKVSWVMDLGCYVTVEAVNKIIQKFSTDSVTSDPYADYINSTGIRVECEPEYTPERRQWAIDCVTSQYSNVKFNGFRFELETGEYYHHAMEDYTNYLENGVTSNLFDEYGEENIEKKWYYEDLNPTVKATEEPKEVEKEEKSEIIPVNLYSLAEPIYIQGKYPSLNKCNNIQQYIQQKDVDSTLTQVSKIIKLTPKDYDFFLQNLLCDYEWLKGEGGSDSFYQTHYGDDSMGLINDEVELEKWLAERYTIAVVVTNGSEYILVDPQGYSYARYVGFGVDATLDEILNPEQPKPETEAETENKCPELPSNPEVPAQTNVIKFPTTPAKNDNFYEQVYEAWVKKMVYQGQLSKIKSFEDWLAIALDILP